MIITFYRGWDWLGFYVDKEWLLCNNHRGSGLNKYNHYNLIFPFWSLSRICQIDQALKLLVVPKETFCMKTTCGLLLPVSSVLLSLWWWLLRNIYINPPVHLSPWNKACYVMFTMDHGSPSTIIFLYALLEDRTCSLLAFIALSAAQSSVQTRIHSAILVTDTSNNASHNQVHWLVRTPYLSIKASNGAEINLYKLLKNSMFVNISDVMIYCYPISEWEVPFNWEWLIRNSFKTITSFAYFQEN